MHNIGGQYEQSLGAQEVDGAGEERLTPHTLPRHSTFAIEACAGWSVIGEFARWMASLAPSGIRRNRHLQKSLGTGV
jgi:hypothetical protein